MQFNSYLFILFFLPVTLAGYFVLNKPALRRGGSLLLPNLWLLGMSLWFYGYFNVSYLLLIIVSIIVNFCLGKCLNGDFSGGAFAGSRPLLVLGILFNTGLIFYFKYYDFFVGNLNAAFRTDFHLKHLLLPLGISFFTFQQLSFVIDSYRKETCGYGFVEYALFVSFFPQLVAGPIVLHSELIPQFRDACKRTVDYTNLSTGLMMFTLGLSKKVLIADVLGQCVTWGFTHVESASAIDTLFVMLSYTFQIYFDFSGYSDMATGLSRMFNLTIPQNFNSPYQATSITEFWSRWHMTLTRFLRKYVYFPLGGSRGVTAGLSPVSHALGDMGTVPSVTPWRSWKTYRNIMVVFLVSGLWHGANWTFILWGLLHGLCQIVERTAGKCVTVPFPLTHLKRFTTFLIVNLLWLLFRADSVTQWGQLLTRLASGDFYLHEDAVRGFKVPGLVTLIHETIGWYPQRKIFGACGLVFLTGCVLLCLLPKNNYLRTYNTDKKSLAWTAGLLLFCLMSLSTVSVFLYFNF